MRRDRAKKISIDCDRKTVETVLELVSLYKREFGDRWQEAFLATVRVSLGSL